MFRLTKTPSKAGTDFNMLATSASFFALPVMNEIWSLDMFVRQTIYDAHQLYKSVVADDISCERRFLPSVIPERVGAPHITRALSSALQGHTPRTAQTAQ
jgi:hypothetical protein